jgi:hypothetical protein
MNLAHILGAAVQRGKKRKEKKRKEKRKAVGASCAFRGASSSFSSPKAGVTEFRAEADITTFSMPVLSPVH